MLMPSPDVAASAARPGWADRPPRLAKIYTVGGPTGGSGKTMLATNLAFLLAETTGKRVVVVDTDLQFGEVFVALQLKPNHSLYDLLYDAAGAAHDDLELSLSLRENLTRTPMRFEVLPAPFRPSEAAAVGPEELERVLANLRKQSDYIIIDTPTGLSDHTLTAMRMADALVCVTQVDVPGLYNLRTYLESVEHLGIRADRRVVILNKDLRESGVTAADAMEVIGPVHGVVPFCVEVTRALNSGRTVTASAPDEAVSGAIRASLRTLLPADAESRGHSGPRRRRWPFGRGGA